MNRCYCPEECLSKGGTDSDGRPLGYAFATAHLLRTHQIRIKRERLERKVLEDRIAHQNQAQAVEAAGAQLFVTTLLDSTSMSNSTTSSNEPLSHSGSSGDSSIQAIVAGVQRIALLPEAGITGTEDESRQFSLETPRPSASLSPISQAPASDQQSTQASSKADRNQHTKTALDQLNNIELCILTAADELAGIPSSEKIAETKELVKAWREAIASINRKLSVVKTRKTQVMEVLRRLEARLLEVDIISPSDPISYNTGKLFALTS